MIEELGRFPIIIFMAKSFFVGYWVLGGRTTPSIQPILFMPNFVDTWKRRAHQLKTEVYALYLAYKDPRTPWYARIFAAVVVAYAFSPIDLIPDPIPILGYLDDLVLIPLGVWIALKMIPAEVISESRAKAKEVIARGKPVNKVAATIIVLIWIGLAILVGVIVYKWVKH
jgi:uncharacterized membrane protein YkvA (DUF1232 family)